MAQGRTQEAAKFYRNGGKAARASGDARLAATGRVLTREMDIERNRIALDALDSGTAKQVLRGGVDFGCQAAAGDIAVRHALDTGGVDRALSVLDGIWERAPCRNPENRTSPELLVKVVCARFEHACIGFDRSS